MILKIAIDTNDDDIIQLIIEKIFELIEKEDYGYITLLPIISLKLPELYDRHYSGLVMKYILGTSILPDPSCSSVKDSKDTSLYAYSKNIYIKLPSNYDYFEKVITVLFVIFTFPIFLIYKIFTLTHLKTQEKIKTISFIVPFPQICKYQERGYNPWNEMLYKPKSILFCNIDSNNYYKWWNFAAIIDFKWKNFGRSYYFLIWSFYTIFFICFA